MGAFSKLAPYAGLLSSLAGLSNAQGSFFTIFSNPLVVERVDPIISPGAVSNHLHNVFGANNFGPNWDYDTMQKSSCNTVGPKQDHSNYWFPALHFQDPNNGSFTRVPAQLEIYYHLDPQYGAREEFPPGFKMLSGNAMLRSNDSDPMIKSSRWYCHGGVPNGDVISAGGPFAKGFSDCTAYPGLSGEIWFPFCWNGNDYNPDDPNAHVSFSESGDETGGPCPASHPRILPHLFMEFHHDISQFKGLYTADDMPWVLATGDPTGYSMHADFVNGWEVGVLDAAMKVVNPATNETACFVGDGDSSTYFDFYDSDTISSCQIAPVVDEANTGPYDKLPGCNPIQTGPAMAQIKTGCDAPTTFNATVAGASNATESAAPSPPVASSVASSAVVSAPASSAEAGSSKVTPVPLPMTASSSSGLAMYEASTTQATLKA